MVLADVVAVDGDIAIMVDWDEVRVHSVALSSVGTIAIMMWGKHSMCKRKGGGASGEWVVAQMPVVGIEIENWHKATGCPYPLPIDHSWLGCNHDRFGMLKLKSHL